MDPLEIVKNLFGLQISRLRYGMKYEKEVRNHMFFCVTGFTTGSILYNGDIWKWGRF